MNQGCQNHFDIAAASVRDNAILHCLQKSISYLFCACFAINMFVSKINCERSEPEKNSVGRIKKLQSLVVGTFELLVCVIKIFYLY